MGGLMSFSLLALSMALVLIVMMIGHNPALSQGESTKDYTIQLRIFVDSSAERSYKIKTGKADSAGMKKELESLFVDMTDLYKSLTKYISMTFSFEILEVSFLNKTLFDNGRKGENAIADFWKWVEPTYISKHYDIALLITNVNMRGGIGFGYIGDVCTSKSVGVVPYTATFKDAISWAHEIGHILGAEHDYEIQEGAACHFKDGKIMNPSMDSFPNENNYVFSVCTASYVREKMNVLEKDGKNCLKDGGSNKVKGPQFGTLMTPDQVCQRMHGMNSFVDVRQYKYSQSGICVRLYCQAKPYWKNRYSKDYAWSPPGMKCGKQKICVNGECVQNAKGNPLLDDNCPFGDQLKTGYEGYWDQVCGQIDLRDCNHYGQDCCHTCNTANAIYNMTADQVCAALQGENSYLHRNSYDAYGDELCKELRCIKGTNGLDSNIQSFDTPDGMACAKEKRCYKGYCVPSRDGKTQIEDDTCPFGDQNLDALGHDMTCPQLDCISWKNACCRSCQGSL